MPSIPENVNETINGARSHENGHFFPQDSWNDASFNSLKRNRDADMKMFSNFNGLEDQVGISPFFFFFPLFNRASIYVCLLYVLATVAKINDDTYINRVEKQGKALMD